jgi:hypothetical protein
MLKAIVIFLLLACRVAMADERAVIVEKGKDRFETEFAPGGRLQLEVVTAQRREFNFSWRSRPSAPRSTVLVEEPAFRPASRREMRRASAPVEDDHGA